MIRATADEARRQFRKLLSEVEHGGVVEISRYKDPAAVMVPPGWYERAIGEVGEPDPMIDSRRVR